MNTRTDARGIRYAFMYTNQMYVFCLFFCLFACCRLLDQSRLTLLIESVQWGGEGVRSAMTRSRGVETRDEEEEDGADGSRWDDNTRSGCNTMLEAVSNGLGWVAADADVSPAARGVEVTPAGIDCRENTHHAQCTHTTNEDRSLVRRSTSAGRD
jgi:hypothetical protein